MVYLKRLSDATCSRLASAAKHHQPQALSLSLSSPLSSKSLQNYETDALLCYSLEKVAQLLQALLRRLRLVSLHVTLVQAEVG